MIQTMSSVIRVVLDASYDFVLFDEKIKHTIDYISLNFEYLGSFVTFDDALLDRLANDSLLDHHVLFVIDIETTT